MPTYEYQCTSCEYRFEMFQGMTEKPLKRCPRCRHKVNRLLGTGAGIIFKGSGFYETDYRRKGYKEAENKEKPPAAEKKSDAGATAGKKEKNKPLSKDD